MRTLVILAVVLLAGLLYLAVALRVPSARSALRFMVRAGWIWACVILALGVYAAFERWG